MPSKATGKRGIKLGTGRWAVPPLVSAARLVPVGSAPAGPSRPGAAQHRVPIVNSVSLDRYL